MDFNLACTMFTVLLNAQLMQVCKISGKLKLFVAYMLDVKAFTPPQFPTDIIWGQPVWPPNSQILLSNKQHKSEINTLFRQKQIHCSCLLHCASCCRGH